MSKKFQKLKLVRQPQSLPILSLADFVGAQDNYSILDIDWGDGGNFLAQSELWLQQSRSDQKLYYYALVPHPSLNYVFGDSFLARELAEKWPPILPGSQILECAAGRIVLVLFFNDACQALEGLLQHHLAAIDKKERYFGFHRVLLHYPVAGRLAELIYHLCLEEVKVLGYALTPICLSPVPRLKNSPWPWAKYPSQTQKINIIGAGLAGAYLARILADAGWQVEVFEALSVPASLGSGNRFSVLYPKFSLYQAPFTEIIMQAYPYAFQIWSKILADHPELGRICPLRQTLTENESELISVLDASPAWFVAGQGLTIQNSLIIDIPALCQYLLQHPQIQVHYQHPIVNIPHQGLWVWATGYQSPVEGIKGMRGQMTHVSAFYPENMIYCDQGHILPAWKGIHALGATFSTNWVDLHPQPQDDVKNLISWQPFFQHKMQVVDQWVGVRSVSLDHLPLVGWLPEQVEFLQDFKVWQHHANWVMTEKMANQSTLIFSGFGSRGLVFIPLMARVLQSLISLTPPLLANPLMQAISPGRFLKRRLSKIRT